MVELVKYIIPVVAVAFGWFLNELGTLLRVKRDEKRALYSAIANLLELRYYMVAFHTAHTEIESKLQISASEYLQMLHSVDAFIPSPQEMSTRYNRAVDLVISTNPTLGFQLRSQEVVPILIRNLRGLIGGNVDEPAAALWLKLEGVYTRLVKPEMDSLLLSMSWSCGLKMWWRVKRLMKKQERYKVSPAHVTALRDLREIDTDISRQFPQ